jgi:Cu2+-exporting ATPase
MAPGGCFHCGLPVPAGTDIRARVLGAERRFCCHGCEAIACTIEAGGFAKYYESRTAPARTAAPLVPFPALLEDPAAEAQYVARLGEHGREATLVLEGMTCAACAWLAEASLSHERGVSRASVNATTGRAVVAWDSRATSLGGIVRALRAIGLDAWPWEAGRAELAARAEERRELWRLFVAGFGAMQVMMYALPGYLDAGETMSAEAASFMRWAGFVITLPVLLISCRPFFEAAWRELLARRIGLEAPIALGIAGGFLASAWATVTGSGEAYFDSISMLAFLLLAARWTQATARRRAGRELERRLRWMPETATRLGEQGARERISADALREGDKVLVAPGERVPADGQVLEGDSSVDEALLTGESRPVRKLAGDALTGGSVNLEQPLVMEVRRAGAQAWAAGIARLVDRAAAARPDLLPAADRAARWLTSLVLVVAAGAFAAWWQFAPERATWIAVAVLVATCPCALALATPIALTAASSRLLDRGVVMLRGRAIQSLAGATDVVFDKTGTLTEGRYSLEAVRVHGGMPREDCLALAAGLALASRHPASRVFHGLAANADVTCASQVPGGGMTGVIAGEEVRLGSHDFCAALAGVSAPARAQIDDARRTVVHLARWGEWLASFSLEDSIRPGARTLVWALQQDGLRVHLLSGDRRAAAASMAQRLGIRAVAAGCSPEKKLAYVGSLQAQGRTVVMVGDGLNDTPVLARADCAIAVAGGSDAAQLQADLVLLGGDLGALAALFGIGRKAMTIVRQNVGWAIAYNAVALPAAALGAIGPWEAAIGMSASSLIVAVNALRVLRDDGQEAPWNPSISSSPSPSRSSS